MVIQKRPSEYMFLLNILFFQYKYLSTVQCSGAIVLRLCSDPLQLFIRYIQFCNGCVLHIAWVSEIIHKNFYRYGPFDNIPHITRNLWQFKQFLFDGNRPTFRDNVNEDLVKLVTTSWVIETDTQRRPTAEEIEKYLLENGPNYIRSLTLS